MAKKQLTEEQRIRDTWNRYIESEAEYLSKAEIPENYMSAEEQDKNYSELMQRIDAWEEQQETSTPEINVSKQEATWKRLKERLQKELTAFTVPVPGFAAAHAKTSTVNVQTEQGLLICFIEIFDDLSFEIGLSSFELELEGIKLRLVEDKTGWKSDVIVLTKPTEAADQVGGFLSILPMERPDWGESPVLSLELVD